MEIGAKSTTSTGGHWITERKTYESRLVRRLTISKIED
jgi:hypothetical protein